MKNESEVPKEPERELLRMNVLVQLPPKIHFSIRHIPLNEEGFPEADHFENSMKFDLRENELVLTMKRVLLQSIDEGTVEEFLAVGTSIIQEDNGPEGMYSA